jgi:hypothetical protein
VARISMTAGVIAIAILASPVDLRAQRTSGGADGGSAGGAGNSANLVLPPPGTNGAGTARSSGPGINTGPGVTTGSANISGNSVSGPQTNGDAAIAAEDKAIESKLKSICRGC